MEFVMKSLFSNNILWAYLVIRCSNDEYGQPIPTLNGFFGQIFTILWKVFWKRIWSQTIF
jgi:hypothetical protein